jgi:thioredoxin-related protein
MSVFLLESAMSSSYGHDGVISTSIQWLFAVLNAVRAWRSRVFSSVEGKYLLHLGGYASRVSFSLFDS